MTTLTWKEMTDCHALFDADGEVVARVTLTIYDTYQDSGSGREWLTLPQAKACAEAGVAARDAVSDPTV